MNNVQHIKLLSNIAKSTITEADEYSDLVVFNEGASSQMKAIAEALAKRKSEEALRAAEDVAEEVLELIKQANEQIESSRVTLAAHRREIIKTRNKIENTAVARVYGERTMNWLPLTYILGRVKFQQQVNAISHPDFFVPPMEAQKILDEIKQKLEDKKTSKKK